MPANYLYPITFVMFSILLCFYAWQGARRLLFKNAEDSRARSLHGGSRSRFDRSESVVIDPSGIILTVSKVRRRFFGWAVEVSVDNAGDDEIIADGTDIKFRFRFKNPKSVSERIGETIRPGGSCSFFISVLSPFSLRPRPVVRVDLSSRLYDWTSCLSTEDQSSTTA